MRSRSVLSIPAVLLIALVAAAPAAARQTPGASQPPSPQPPPATAAPAPAPALPDPSIAEVETRLHDVETSTDLDDATRQTAIAAYRDALENLKAAGDLAPRVAEFARLTEEAPARLAAIREELAKPAAEPKPQPPDGATLVQLEQMLTNAQSDLEAARKQASDLQAEQDTREQRAKAIQQGLTASRQQLAEATATLAGGGPADPTAEPARAQRTLLAARRLRLQREIEAAEKEQASIDARRDLLPARRDLAVRRAAEGEKLVAAWQQLVNQRRAADAEEAIRQAERARRDAASRHPAVRDLADENAKLAASRTGPDAVTQRIARVERLQQSTRQQLDALRSSFRSIRRRLAVSGETEATGVLLRHHNEAIPNIDALARQVQANREELADAEYRLVVLQDKREAAGDIDGEVQRFLAERDFDETEAHDVESTVRELYIARRDLLDQLIADYRSYVDRLIDLDDATRDLLETAREQRAFIAERILWDRSVTGGNAPNLTEAGKAIAWLTAPSAWWEALVAAGQEALRLWFAVGALAFALIASVAARRMFGRRLDELAKRLRSYRTDSIVLTLRALGLTVLRALPAPLLLWSIGWLLAAPREHSALAAASSEGLQLAALVVFPLETLRQMLRPEGIAEAHFRWPQRAVQLVRRHLLWFIPVITPLLVLVVTLERQSVSGFWNDSLGRLGFMAAMMALAVFVQRVARPSGAAVGAYLERNPGGWVARLRFIWYGAAVGLPLALVVVAWLGYYYTALQLERRLTITFLLALGLIIVSALLLRWLALARRRVHMEEARRQRQAAGAGAGGGEDAGAAAAAAARDEMVDLPAIDSQTRRLIGAAVTVTAVIGLYTIWATVLPALHMLDRVQIWPEVLVLPAGHAEVDPGDAGPNGPATAAPATAAPAPASNAGANGAAPSGGAPMLPGATPSLPASESEPSAKPPSVVANVTLADVGLAIIILLVTFAAVRNLPGLVEIIVLQNLALDRAARYALGSILRYTIVIVGITIACGSVGISWTTVQWLAAALTFGLAFGLQEIFANFVSGVIILFERPIRIADSVTVGGVTGTVARIRMRATTIVDWDRKELIVPNKAFITDQVINWTLSDPVLRVIIPVGVSYSADIDKTEGTLLAVARRNERVLADPAPQVLFLQFGDSALNFELRVFIPNIDHYQQVRHELHMAIMKAFREAGIEIAFPQRDLHLRSAEGLKKLVQKREDLAEWERE